MFTRTRPFTVIDVALAKSEPPFHCCGNGVGGLIQISYVPAGTANKQLPLLSLRPPPTYVQQAAPVPPR